MSDVMTRFEAIFPAENIKLHLIGGVYDKEHRIPAGWKLTSHAHRYDHMSILSSGRAKVTVDGVAMIYVGSAVINIRAEKEHSVEALTDCVWHCIHPVSASDTEGLDETLIMREGF